MHALDDVEAYSALTGRQLRTYQTECARAIARSVLYGEGKIITLIFARRMGKNETSAQLEAYVVRLHARRGGSMVKAAPSFKPQVINSILRLKQTLDDNPLTRRRWRPIFGYMIQLGSASIAFLCADAKANVVGATASRLLDSVPTTPASEPSTLQSYQALRSDARSSRMTKAKSASTLANRRLVVLASKISEE
jgi:hypothetical protein